MCGNHMDLKKRLDILEETVRNLQRECQRLYQTGFSNGVEVARKEYTDELKMLEDKGLISYHGFLKSESKEQTLSDLYPTMHCATGSCSGCDEIYLENGMGDLFKYTCKKKNITIISNVTPTPENFAKAFKKE